MRNRKQRVELIVDLIRARRIGSQDELSSLLAEYGFITTQATLSRDLKKLKITKVPADGGGYTYVLPDGSDSEPDGRESATVEFSGNMAVVKTRNGYAAGLAYDIDQSNPSEILGTIPGTDTILIVLRDGVDRDRAFEVISAIIPVERKSFPSSPS